MPTKGKGPGKDGKKRTRLNKGGKKVAIPSQGGGKRVRGRNLKTLTAGKEKEVKEPHPSKHW